MDNLIIKTSMIYDEVTQFSHETEKPGRHQSKNVEGHALHVSPWRSLQASPQFKEI
jgi:hypothetical protein